MNFYYLSKKSKKVWICGVCPRCFYSPLQYFSGKCWIAHVCRETNTPEGDSYSGPLQFGTNLPFRTASNHSSQAILLEDGLWSVHCNTLLPAQEEPLMIIFISSTWPSAAAWCKGEALVSSYLLNFLLFLIKFCNLCAFSSKTT